MGQRRVFFCALAAWTTWLGACTGSPENTSANGRAQPPPADQPAREQAPPGAGFKLLVRLAQISDTHVVDVASPARFAGADGIVGSAWRPQEAYSTQILDGMIRTVNRIHASGRRIDFLLHTGDGVDNVQGNELRWMLGVLDGDTILPLSGPDDRPPDQRPAPELDPFAPFQAQGLYQQGRHGDLPSIPWYAVIGNHDVFALGNFPIIEKAAGHRVAPLPLDWRPGFVLPVVLDPVGDLAYGPVTPAHPGPPRLLEFPTRIPANPERAYFNKAEFVAALAATATGPPGHGIGANFANPPPADAADGAALDYSVNPVPGVRLIALDTTTVAAPHPGGIYSEGALSRAQLDFLQSELNRAAAAAELVVVATHHPSAALTPLSSSEVTGDELRAVLSAAPQVVLHLAGHTHRNRVQQRDGYLEIETCATLDPPQEGRLIELWQNPADGTVAVAYEMFSHIDDALPPLGVDPLRPLREVARTLAENDKRPVQARYPPATIDYTASSTEAVGRLDPQAAHSAPADRSGMMLRR